MDPTHHCVVVGDAETLDGSLGAIDVESVSAASVATVVEATPPDCVVVVGSADGDGIEAVEAVRTVSSSIPVVYATPEPSGRVAAAATQAGADEYVVIDRPVDGDGHEAISDASLAARVDVLVDGAQPDDRGSNRYDVDRTRRETPIKRLLSTTRALFACDTPEEIADVVTEAAADVFGFDYVAVRLFDDETDELVLEAGTDAVVEHVGDRERVHVGESPIGDAFESGDPLVIDDVRIDSPYDFGHLRGAMCIPVGRYGTLTVCSSTVGAFSMADVKLAQLLTANAEAALEGVSRRETLVRHEQVLEAVEGMVYALDADGHFTLVTEPFAERLGYERDELVGEHASILLADADVDRAIACIRTLLSDPDRSSTAYEATMQTAIGEEFPVEIELSLLPVEDDFRGTVGTVRDITERKERERYLQVLNRVLRHNLRNDLTVVMGYADILTRGVEDDGLARTAETVHDISTDLAELSEDAKRIERTLRRGRVEGYPVDLGAVVDRVIAHSDSTYRDATIDVDVPDDLVVRADDELVTALDHLVENAVVHNPVPEPTVRIGACRSGRTVTLAVDDDGPGIPRAEREVITGDRDITQLTHGSGLGLWLVRWIVDSYGGRITFSRSNLGGSRVEISLEAASAGAAGN